MRVVAASSAAAVTVAPGIDRPASSVTTTRMFPVVVTCAPGGPGRDHEQQREQCRYVAHRYESVLRDGREFQRIPTCGSPR